GLHLLGEFLHADLVDEYLDARLVDVVAAAVLVVHAQDRLDVAQEVALGQERLDGLRQVGNAAEPAADADLEAGLALGIAIEPQADVVDFYGGAIVRGGRDGDLEFARQEREFRVQRGVLADQLGPDARILDLLRRHAGPLIGGDVADGIAAGLDAVQPVPRQIAHGVGQLFQLDPVELDVLPRGEVPVAAVVVPRNVGERAHLLGRQRAVRNADAQHVGMQLQVDAVEQAQQLELVLGQLAGETPPHLVAELGDALLEKGPVELVVDVHGGLAWASRRPRAARWSGRQRGCARANFLAARGDRP